MFHATNLMLNIIAAIKWVERLKFTLLMRIMSCFLVGPIKLALKNKGPVSKCMDSKTMLEAELLFHKPCSRI